MLSQPRALDQAFLKRIASLEAMGAEVDIVTTEGPRGGGRAVTREVTIRWETHNPEAAVLPRGERIPDEEWAF